MDALDNGFSACKNLLRLTIVLMVIFSTSLSLAPRREREQVYRKAAERLL